jgi:hypothetical protein
MRNEKRLYSLIPLEEFRAVLGLDDREDALSRYCLVTATYSIEQYCMRRLLRKKHFERIEFTGDLLLPLREYPVIAVNREQITMNSGDMIESEFYRVVPECGSYEDWPYALALSPSLKRRLRFVRFINVVYWAGYRVRSEKLGMRNVRKGEVPGDWGAACLELAAWNMARYRGRRIGLTGAVRGKGRDGEHLELVMPLQVRELLEPYRRKVV